MQPKIHIGKEIRQQLKVQGQSVRWLAEKISCDPSNLNKKLKCKCMDTHVLFIISEALDVDFFLKLSRDFVETQQAKLGTIIN